MKFLNERYNTSVRPRTSGSAFPSRTGRRWPIVHLQKATAAVRFLSIEPLIDRLASSILSGIDWVIVGGESGPRARPMDPRWAIDIRNQCLSAKVAFFFKQWGGRSPKSRGRLLEGKEWNQFPVTRERGAGRLQMRASA